MTAASGVTLGFLKYVMGMDTLQFESGSKKVQRQLRQMERQIGAMADRISGFGQRLTIGLTVPLGAFGVAAARAASDAAELQSAFNQTFGDLSAMMNDWAEVTGDALGRSTQELQRGANAFGLYFNQAAETRAEAARMSQTFTVLAQDLASFHNTSVDEALTALRSGLSGETEPLRRYGVFLNEAAVQAQALEMGLRPVNGRLTDQQKIMARSALIMEATATAQGDVLRTADSSANRVRALGGAWEELKVTVGEKLLPLLTPFVEKLTSMVNAFSNLPAPLQNTLLVLGGIAAVAGPILVAVGGLVSALGPLAAAFSVAAGGAGIFGTALGAVAAVGAPVIAVAAAIAAAGALIYANWDKIGPVLSDIGEQLRTALGPAAQQIITTLSTTMRELWTGPFGEMLRTVGQKLLEFEVLKLRIFGPVFVALVRGLANAIANAFGVIGGVIQTVSRLMAGDFSGAWTAATGTVQSFVALVDGAFFNLPSTAIASVQRLVAGVRQYIVGGLNAIWNEAIRRIDTVKSAFFNLYDAVVGNSYIPDMVDGIAAHMRRLDAEMVQPVTDATERAGNRFRDLQALLADLFPDAVRRNSFAEQSALLTDAFTAGELGADEYSAAMGRLRRQFEDIGQTSVIRDVAFGVDDLAGGMEESADRTEAASVRIVESFAQLTQGALSELDRMLKGIRSGNFLDILSGLLGTLDKIGGITGGFNIGPLQFGRLAGARANGGPVSAGRSYLVGERGPEIFTAGTSGRIISNDNMRAGGGFSVSVTPSPLFSVVVRDMAGQVVAQAAPAIAGVGAELGQAGMMRRASRVPA